jgi:hypothetical protein
VGWGLLGMFAVITLAFGWCYDEDEQKEVRDALDRMRRDRTRRMGKD